MYSLRQITAENHLRTHPFTRLHVYFQQFKPYKVIICASEHLAKYQTKIPPDPNISWVVQTMKKGDQDADVNTLLTGEGIEHILLNTLKIKKLYLGSGDKDLAIILEKAQSRKIDCEIIGIKPEFIAHELKEMVPKCHFLY